MELNQMFRDCLSIFEKGSFDINGEHYACAIQYEINALAPHAHNCIACNLADEINYIFLFLKSNKERDTKDDVRQYIMYLYIFIEHIETVLGILNIPDCFKNKHFKVFNRIRKWANFFKHPKSFVLTHHPIYRFDSDVESLTDNNSLLINDKFLTNYYSGGVEPEKRKRLNEELFNKMKNNSNVVVCLPNILTLTKSFCYSYKKAIETIVKNQIYLEVLSDETTIQKYFLNLSDF